MNLESIGSAAQSVQPGTYSTVQAREKNAAVSTTPGTSAPAQQVVSPADGKQGKPSLEDAVRNIENFVSAVNSEISFSIDQASGAQVVKVMDTQSKEVIRQIPSEEAIQLAQALDKLQGLFVKAKA
jgi:flagellar protein FlaG